MNTVNQTTAGLTGESQGWIKRLRVQYEWKKRLTKITERIKLQPELKENSEEK